MTKPKIIQDIEGLYSILLVDLTNDESIDKDEANNFYQLNS